MKPCLKAKCSPTPVLCTHRKCVAFGAQISEEVHIADEWDRTPTEPTRKLSYQDLLELKEIQRSLPHASQPCDLTGGRLYLSQVPIALVPLLPNLLDTPPSSGTCSPYSSSSSSSRTSSPPPHTPHDSSPHSSPDSNPFLPLLLDDPDPHPLFPSGKNSCRKPKKKKFIIVNDIEMEMDDSDSDSDDDELDDDDDHQQFKLFDPKRSATPTPPSTPTHIDLDLPTSALFSNVSLPAPPPWSRDTSRYPPSLLIPSSPPHFPYPPRPRSWCENPSPLSSSSPQTPKPKSPTSPSINVHIPMRFKRSGSGSCLNPCSNLGTGPTPALSRVRGV